MKVLNKILFLVVTLLCFVSCGSNDSKRRDNHNSEDQCIDSETAYCDSIVNYYSDYFGDYDSIFYYYEELHFSPNDIVHALTPMDIPDRIDYYVDALIADGKFIPGLFRWGTPEEAAEYLNEIRELANKLQLYKDGKNLYFPQKELKQFLEYLMHEMAYIDNHGGYVEPRDFIIFPRLLEIGTSLCPDIHQIADYCSNDGKLGVVTFEVYNCTYNFAALVTRGDESLEIRYLPDGFTNINKVRKIGSTESYTRYLLSFENSDREIYYCTSPIYVVDIYDNVNYSDVKIHNVSDRDILDEWWSYCPYENHDLHIYFNPKELSWSWCKVNSFGNLEKTRDSQTLILDLESLSLRLE